LIVAVAAALGSAPVAAQSVEQGIDAWRQGDYTNAVAIWRPLAEAGDADAQFNLGQAYRLGRGIPTNVAESQAWFERAAAQGHVDAATTLGLLLFQTGDQAAGLKWLKVAAEQDEPRALLVYGTALYNGDAVTQDPVLGYAYVRRAAAQGLAPAKETLAQLDSIMSAQDRKIGAAMAESLGKNAGTANFGGAKAPQAAKAKPPKPKSGKAAATQIASAETPKSPEPPAIAQPGEPQPAPPKEAKAAVKAPKTVETAAVAVPKKAPPKPALTTAGAAGAWRIQLGAFAQKGNAEALYKKLAGNGALAGRKPFYVAAGAVTRLQVGPFENKAAAEAACRAVSSACFPIPTK
jgi:cell division septation protein DedD